MPQVLLDKEIPCKFLSDIKSALVGALALNGQVSDALRLHDEIMQSGGSLEPKAAIALIVSKSVNSNEKSLHSSLDLFAVYISYRIVFSSSGAYSNRR